jgi:hypothetical protein
MRLFIRLFITAALVLPLAAGTAQAASRYVALYNAVAKNDMPRVKGLTPRGDALNAVDPKTGATPLTWASMSNVDPAIAQWFIEKGADVDRMDGEGETPLTTAANYGNAPVAILLLEHGASPNKTNDRGDHPLVLASGQRGSLAIVKALNRHGASIDSKAGALALETALAFKNFEIAQFLEKNGARPSYFQAVKRLRIQD